MVAASKQPFVAYALQLALPRGIHPCGVRCQRGQAIGIPKFLDARYARGDPVVHGNLPTQSHRYSVGDAPRVFLFRVDHIPAVRAHPAKQTQYCGTRVFWDAVPFAFVERKNDREHFIFNIHVVPLLMHVLLNHNLLYCQILALTN